MKQYVLNNRIINATEKAFDVVYKAQGYVPYVATKKAKKKNKEQKLEIETLRKQAFERGISFTDETTVEELTVLISDSKSKES